MGIADILVRIHSDQVSINLTKYAIDCFDKSLPELMAGPDRIEKINKSSRKHVCLETSNVFVGCFSLPTRDIRQARVRPANGGQQFFSNALRAGIQRSWQSHSQNLFVWIVAHFFSPREQRAAYVYANHERNHTVERRL